MAANETFARRLKRLREGMTVVMLATQCGVPAAEIHDLEAGRMKDPELSVGLRPLSVDAWMLGFGRSAKSDKPKERLALPAPKQTKRSVTPQSKATSPRYSPVMVSTSSITGASKKSLGDIPHPGFLELGGHVLNVDENAAAKLGRAELTA